MSTHEEQVEQLAQEIDIAKKVLLEQQDRVFVLQRQMDSLRSGEFLRQCEEKTTDEERLVFYLMSDMNPQFSCIGPRCEEAFAKLIKSILGRSVPKHTVCLTISENELSYSPLHIDLNLMGITTNIDRLINMCPICADKGLVELFFHLGKNDYMIMSSDKQSWTLMEDERKLISMKVVDGLEDVPLASIIGRLSEYLNECT